MTTQTSVRPPAKENGVPWGTITVIGILLTMLTLIIWVFTTFTPVLPVAKEIMSIVDPKAAWFATRASAIVAYVLLTISVVWGLVLSTKITKEITPAPAVLGLHNAVGWAAIGLGVFHAAALMMDTYYTYSIFNLLIPFTGPYRPFWVGMGTISLYVMFVASASFLWKKWLGQRNWKIIHYLTFPIYGLVTLHGFMTGTDSGTLGTNAMYLGSVLLVLFLTNYRVMAAQQTRRKNEAANAAAD
jgi:predicted ferric reductase